MQVASVSYTSSNNMMYQKRNHSNPHFGNTYAILEKTLKNPSNLDVVSLFVKNWWGGAVSNARKAAGDVMSVYSPETGAKISSANDLASKVDFYLIGRSKNFDENFLTLPIDQNRQLSVSDLGLNGVAKHFANIIEAKKHFADIAKRIPSTPFEGITRGEYFGDLGEIMLRNLYLFRAAEKQNPGSGSAVLKDTIVAFRENIYGEKAQVIAGDFVEAINNPDIHFALVKENRNLWKNFKSQLTRTPETGMFYISADMMTRLVKKVNDIIPANYEGELQDIFRFQTNKTNPFMKNETEIFDSNKIIQWIKSELVKNNTNEKSIKTIPINNEFYLNPPASFVGMVKYEQFIRQLGAGKYLDNFESADRVEIQNAVHILENMYL